MGHLSFRIWHFISLWIFLKNQIFSLPERQFEKIWRKIQSEVDFGETKSFILFRFFIFRRNILLKEMNPSVSWFFFATTCQFGVTMFTIFFRNTKCSSGHLECSFYNSANQFLLNVRKLFAPIQKKLQNINFCQFFCSSGDAKCSFDTPKPEELFSWKSGNFGWGPISFRRFFCVRDEIILANSTKVLKLLVDCFCI